MTSRSSKRSTRGKKQQAADRIDELPQVDSGLEYTSVYEYYEFVRSVYEYIERLPIEDEELCVTFRLERGAALPITGSTHSMVWTIDRLLSKNSAAYRLVDFNVDSSDPRYKVLMHLRPLHLTDLVGIR